MAEPASTTPPRYRRIVQPLLVLGLVLGLAAWFARPDGHVHIFFLDTPGDAVLIETARGSYVLIDGGKDPAQLALHLGQQMPFWRRNLDVVILTQADDVRLAGQVAALQRYQADLVLAPAPLLASQADQRSQHDQASGAHLEAEWLRLVQQQQSLVRSGQAGTQINLDGVQLTILSAGSGDESGMVVQLNYGATSVIFAGAGEEIASDTSVTVSGPVTAVAYPWQREMDTPLLAVWQPQAIIFTTAYEANAPALLTYQERSLNGAALYHNRLNGTIELVSDGQRTWITTER